MPDLWRQGALHFTFDDNLHFGFRNNDDHEFDIHENLSENSLQKINVCVDLPKWSVERTKIFLLPKIMSFEVWRTNSRHKPFFMTLASGWASWTVAADYVETKSTINEKKLKTVLAIKNIVEFQQFSETRTMVWLSCLSLFLPCFCSDVSLCAVRFNEVRNSRYALKCAALVVCEFFQNLFTGFWIPLRNLDLRKLQRLFQAHRPKQQEVHLRAYEQVSHW